jgi:hypothetical protein
MTEQPFGSRYIPRKQCKVESAREQIERERSQRRGKILLRLKRRRNKINAERQAHIRDAYATPDFKELGQIASAVNKAKNWVRQRIG